MKSLIFVTNNLNKLSEVQQIIGKQYSVKSLRNINFIGDVPETQATIEGNAIQKAEYIHDITGCDCFADDTGLEIEALNGAPGVYSARYAGEEKNNKANIKKVLSELEDKKNRNAHFKTVIALILDNKKYTFTGIVNGKIATKPIGDEGFGYDPIFVPDGYKLSFAEMSIAEKNQISHRALAVKKLTDFLKKNLTTPKI